MNNQLFQEGEKELLFLAIYYYFSKNQKNALFIFIMLLIFFRSPPAKQDIFENEIISPSYGKIDSIEKIGSNVKINILLSVTDVHTQYIPINGVVESTKYVKGRFNPFFLLKTEKTDYNERMYSSIKTKVGKITIIQYAGMLARRIVNNLIIDEEVKQGYIFGMIKFSSRVDIIIPDSIKLNVKEGDTVEGGKTVIGLI